MTSAPGFAYPVVFVLPLVMVFVGGYLGRALTQPIAGQPNVGQPRSAPTTSEPIAVPKARA